MLNIFKRKSNDAKPIDLTDWVRAAQSGLRSDVRALSERLESGRFMLPLAAPAHMLSGESTKKPLNVTTHCLSHPETNQPVATMTTRADIMAHLAKTTDWKTGEAPLEYIEIDAKEAMRLMLEGGKECIVINPFHESALELTRKEAEAMLIGNPIPLVRYVGNSPMRKGEKVQIGDPKKPVPDEFKTVVDHFLKSHQDVDAYELLWMFNEERDCEPHFGLKIRPSNAAVDKAALHKEVTLAVKGKVPLRSSPRIDQ